MIMPTNISMQDAALRQLDPQSLALLQQQQAQMQQLQMLQSMAAQGLNPYGAMTGWDMGAVGMGMQQMQSMDPRFYSYEARLEMIASMVMQGMLDPRVADIAVANLQQQYGVTPPPDVSPQVRTNTPPRAADVRAVQNRGTSMSPVEMYNAFFASRGVQLDLTQPVRQNAQMMTEMMALVEDGVARGELKGSVMDFLSTVTNPRNGVNFKLTDVPQDNAYAPLMESLGRVHRHAKDAGDDATATKAMDLAKALLGKFDERTESTQCRQMHGAFTAGEISAQKDAQQAEAVSSRPFNVFPFAQELEQAQRSGPEALLKTMRDVCAALTQDVVSQPEDKRDGRLWAAHVLIASLNLPEDKRALMTQELDAAVRNAGRAQGGAPAAAGIPEVFLLDKVNERFAKAQANSPEAVSLEIAKVRRDLFGEVRKANTPELQQARARTAMALAEKVDLPAAQKSKFVSGLKEMLKDLLPATTGQEAANQFAAELGAALASPVSRTKVSGQESANQFAADIGAQLARPPLPNRMDENHIKTRLAAAQKGGANGLRREMEGIAKDLASWALKGHGYAEQESRAFVALELVQKFSLADKQYGHLEESLRGALQHHLPQYVETTPSAPSNKGVVISDGNSTVHIKSHQGDLIGVNVKGSGHTIVAGQGTTTSKVSGNGVVAQGVNVSMDGNNITIDNGTIRGQVGQVNGGNIRQEVNIKGVKGDVVGLNVEGSGHIVGKNIHIQGQQISVSNDGVMVDGKKVSVAVHLTSPLGDNHARQLREILGNQREPSMEAFKKVTDLLSEYLVAAPVNERNRRLREILVFSDKLKIDSLYGSNLQYRLEDAMRKNGGPF